MIFSIDPGPVLSAYVRFDPLLGVIHEKGKVSNVVLRAKLLAERGKDTYDILGIEGMQSFGANIGRTVLDTCTWIGRFVECARAPVVWPMFRPQVLAHHCGKAKGGDSAIRDAMRRRFGCETTRALSTGQSIRNPECPLFGLTADMWSALAIASYVADRKEQGHEPPPFPECMSGGFLPAPHGRN